MRGLGEVSFVGRRGGVVEDGGVAEERSIKLWHGGKRSVE